MRLSNEEPGSTELVEPVHMETSFWYGKGDIPNEKIRLPPLDSRGGSLIFSFLESRGSLQSRKLWPH